MAQVDRSKPSGFPFLSPSIDLFSNSFNAFLHSFGGQQAPAPTPAQHPFPAADEFEFIDLSDLPDLPDLEASSPGSSTYQDMAIKPEDIDSSQFPGDLVGFDDAYYSVPSLATPQLISPIAPGFSGQPLEDLVAVVSSDGGESDDDDDNVSGSVSSENPDGLAKKSKKGTYTHAITPQDRAMLRAEGYDVPDDAILTKDQEKELRKLRRKIKNKLCAQDARRKKKAYLGGLETKVESSSTTNKALQARVKLLENENKSLMQQLMDLRRSIGQPASVLMVLAVAFSFAAVGGPHLARSTTHAERSSAEGHVAEAALTLQSTVAEWFSWSFTWVNLAQTDPSEPASRPTNDVVFGARSKCQGASCGTRRAAPDL
eukprot:m.287068 g.287068  ORF g.287068 m.287068 type:complete len:372 (+) comp55009_c0_seq1:108-1223(+)